MLFVTAPINTIILAITIVNLSIAIMVSLEQARKILNDKSLSDEQVLQIRDDLRFLVETIFEIRRLKNDSGQPQKQSFQEIKLVF